MKRIVFAAVVLLIPHVAPAQEPITDKERWESRVYEWVGEMSANRDLMLRRRYVVLMDIVSVRPETLIPKGSGETFGVERIDIPHERLGQRIYARQASRFDYRAFHQIDPRVSFSSFPDPLKDGRLLIAPFYETPEDLLKSFQERPAKSD